MRTDRLLGILITLAEKRRVKAKELAQRFEVSLRTIYRDIESISIAGIPIVTFPGADGGIGIADGFTLDRSVLTTDELESIVLGLKTIGSVSTGSEISALLRKLSQEPDRFITLRDDIVIDLASHYRDCSDPDARRYATLLVSRDLEYVLVDEYGPESYEAVDENTLLARWDYVDEVQMVKTVLGLGSGVRVVEPKSLVEAVKAEAQKILNRYPGS